MPHYGRYDSMQTKKSKEKKERAKAKSAKGSILQTDNQFIIKETNETIGTVVETKYNEATILYEGKLVIAHFKKGIDAICNQIVFPGDIVVINQEQSGEYYINNLIERKNILSRIKKDSTRNSPNVGSNHNIAANIDLAVIVVSAKKPPLHPKFIDRYLLLLQDNNIDCAICLNKADLKTEEDEKILDIYRKIKIPVIETSTTENIGIEDLRNILRGKQSIFVGHSGVGKSSLTNAIMETDEIKTSHVSEKSGKGRHTTTSSKYYVWDDDSSIIDTPGIRSLDISNFKPSEIKEYFSEFEDWEGRCKYSNCLHYREPIEECMVKQVVKTGIISQERYDSYVRILRDVINDKSKDYNEE